MSHSKTTTESVYQKIVNTVCEKMKEEFSNEGIDEGTLEDIKKEWTNKLEQHGILEPNSSNKINNIQGKLNYQNKHNENNSDIYSEQLSKNPVLNSNLNLNFKFQYNNNKSLNNPILNSPYFDENNKDNLSNKFDNNFKINSNNINLNNNNDDNNNINNENSNQEIKTEEEINDPYLKYFNENNHQNDEKEENNEEKENDELLSELEDDNEEEEDKESKDYLLCQYEKVHRVKTKWKVTLNEVVLHAKGKEFVYKKLNGDLERDW